MNYNQLYQQNRLSPQSLRNCGFEEGLSSSFPNELYRTQLKQSATCMKDAVVTAMWNFAKLQKILIQAGTASKWKFYHIILCTMHDTASKIKRQQAANQIIKMNSNWQVADFKTFFVPICMSDVCVQEILSLCQIGGPTWVSYPATYEDFYENFTSIMKEIGMSNKMKDVLAGEEQAMDVNPFDTSSTAITFTLEATRSMAGQKWDTITNTISFYFRNFTERDIVSGILYNSKPRVIGQLNQPPIHQNITEETLPCNTRSRSPHSSKSNQSRNLRRRPARNVATGACGIQPVYNPPINFRVDGQGQQQYELYARPVQNRKLRMCFLVAFTIAMIILVVVLTTQ